MNFGFCALDLLLATDQMAPEPLSLFTGLYFHAITPRLILGSQPRSPSDVAHLANHQGVSAILNMQQDRDLHHWAVDLEALKRTAAANGITYVRAPAIDFDPGSLRRILPTAVSQLLSLLRHGKTVYVHCTAGLGRAPAVCIAALYWDGLGILSEDAQDLVRLDAAYDHVTGIRACGPNKVRRIPGAVGGWDVLFVESQEQV